MKFFISILIITISSLVINWKTAPDNSLKSVPKDHLCISKNVSWQTADTNQLEERFHKDEN